MTDTLETSTAGGAPSPNAFEYTYHVRYSEVGRRGLMTLPALINAFQDVSTFQSESLGVGLAWLRNEQRAWVLTHWHIVIDRYPSLCEPVTAGTFATHFRGFTAKRNFYLRDEAGRLIVRADSSWAFMDLAAMRPCRPAPEHVAPYGEGAPLEMPAEGRRIAVPEHLRMCAPISVGPSLIDTNEHVNNCHYVQMAFEQIAREDLPRDVRERGARHVRVDYRRAAVLGDTIYPHAVIDGDRAVVSLTDAEDGVFAVVELR
ncbi:acyl-[acyl-carrier-protein] thioesterase [Collinsella intestinalis]|uniref:acyl-[acyl-carrier-protein] thioesterase n=1 Tax=Collinsella intestinalis TaxID=147207 RepID=UPI0025A4B07D|nr:acyl-ACP thioesterase domain-containing protein [Collinsella intestinalis]MDM8162677.1 thioesterase [Collinsella intestinalis]